MLSASALADDERQARAIGADFFMRKPYDERELFEWIARVLAVRDLAWSGRDSLVRGQKDPRAAADGLPLGDR